MLPCILVNKDFPLIATFCEGIMKAPLTRNKVIVPLAPRQKSDPLCVRPAQFCKDRPPPPAGRRLEHNCPRPLPYKSSRGRHGYRLHAGSPDARREGKYFHKSCGVRPTGRPGRGHQGIGRTRTSGRRREITGGAARAAAPDDRRNGWSDRARGPVGQSGPVRSAADRLTRDCINSWRPRDGCVRRLTELAHAVAAADDESCPVSTRTNASPVRRLQ